MTEVKELLAEIEAARVTATPGPWLYRPWAYDDWGVVRAPNGNGHDVSPMVAQARAGDPVSNDQFAEHRKNRTDPYGDNAKYIALLNPANIALILTHIAEQEALLREQYPQAFNAGLRAAAEAVRTHRPDASFDDSQSGHIERQALLANVAQEILALAKLPESA